ncbi:hypothetical protein RUM43_003962 [Polyplax serrata]|uniref:Uncharacterized protein n=1 Tax=Polyplax serrata TaxID=468196 RepID=A0AAN8PP74_POLSC
MTLKHGKKKKAVKNIPFGTTTQRFSNLGYHPKRETRPGTVHYSNIFPGCHDWNKPQKIISKIPSWKRCLEVEEYSRRLAYHGDHILARRKWDKCINGPGWHNLPDLPPGRDTKFLKKARFSVPKAKSSVPGPGTYGKNHVPFTLKEENSKEKGFSFSNVMPFQATRGRPKSLDPQPSYHLPPNVYNIKSSTEQLISKRTSKRGPYDLFTGPRFQIKGLIIPKSVDTKQLPALKIDPNAWNHPKNMFKGKFMRSGKDSIVTTRIALENQTANQNILSNPGPSDYNPFPPVVIPPSNFPFNSSVMNARPTGRTELQPPPGRYYTGRMKRIFGDGLRSAFISKTARCVPNIIKFSWFE